MQILIFNQSDRALAGIVEAFEYLRWTRRYSQCGGFELKAVAIDENITLLQIGNILCKSDDAEAGIIEYLELTAQEQEYITVSGRFATSLLARRIVWGTETLTGELSNAVSQLLENHIIAPANTDRAIGGIAYTPSVTGVSVSTQVSFKNLMDTVAGLCEAADIGLRTIFTPQSGLFTVELYFGAVSQAVFSKEYEKIIEQVFTVSLSDYTNTALVGGEGEGSARTFAIAGSGIGLDRYEMFVDAKDLRSEDFPDGYETALLFRGNSRLTEHALAQAFDVTVNQYGNLQYKTDFDLGSVIRAVSKRWGVSVTARITAVEESYDRDGMSLSVTFGKPLLTLAEKIKRSDD
jgi:hypothetical protein